MALILLTIGIVGLAMLAMAVGAMFSNRCLRGSCGGPDVLGPGGEPLGCGACPRRRAGAAENRAAERSASGGLR